MPAAHSRLLLLASVFAVSACSSGDTASDTATAAAVPSDAPAAVETPVAVAPAGDPAADDFLNYELTMDKMRKWAAVTGSFATMSGTPAEMAAMKDVKIGSEPIAESERKIEAIGPMKRVFAAQGLTPREYHMITGAYGMSQLPNSKNAEFAKANKTEIDKLMAGMR